MRTHVASFHSCWQSRPYRCCCCCCCCYCCCWWML